MNYVKIQAYRLKIFRPNIWIPYIWKQFKIANDINNLLKEFKVYANDRRAAIKCKHIYKIFKHLNLDGYKLLCHSVYKQNYFKV